MMELPDELRLRFESELAATKEEKTVEYISSIERSGIEKGRNEALVVTLETIEMVLDARFGPSGAKLMPKVRRLGGLSELRKFVRLLKKADSLAEVREYFE
jgi:hypothetical protein